MASDNKTQRPHSSSRHKRNGYKGDTKRQPLLIVLLVVLESIFSIALRLDKRLRQQVYPLAETSAVWCIRTYLPHVIVYVSFTSEGILLDSKKPDDIGEPDVIISGSLLAITRAALLSDTKAVSKLQFRGDNEYSSHSREFLENLGVQRIAASIFERIRQFGGEDTTFEHNQLLNYKKQLTTQTKAVETLQQQLQSAEASLATQKRRAIAAMTSSVVMAAVTLVIVLIHYV